MTATPGAVPSGMLTPVEYQLLAAPALQTAVELAAQRGNPHLYNDMASMLALLGMVGALVHTYLEESTADASPRAVLEAAPLSVCALVFTESGLEAFRVDDCLRALSAAYLQLLRHGVLGPQDAYIEKAYRELRAGQRPAAQGSLKLAAYAIARAVDAWEARRELDFTA